MPGGTCPGPSGLEAGQACPLPVGHYPVLVSCPCSRPCVGVLTPRAQYLRVSQCVGYRCVHSRCPRPGAAPRAAPSRAPSAPLRRPAASPARGPQPLPGLRQGCAGAAPGPARPRAARARGRPLPGRGGGRRAPARPLALRGWRALLAAGGHPAASGTEGCEVTSGGGGGGSVRRGDCREAGSGAARPAEPVRTAM